MGGSLVGGYYVIFVGELVSSVDFRCVGRVALWRSQEGRAGRGAAIAMVYLAFSSCICILNDRSGREGHCRPCITVCQKCF